jgi:hypothetical protein
MPESYGIADDPGLLLSIEQHGAMRAFKGYERYKPVAQSRT